MITAVLIDDEIVSLEALQLKIQRASDEIKVIHTFDSAPEAAKHIEKLAPDVIFLDVEMPEMDGFDFLSAFPDRSFEVVITTAHSEYAIQAVRQSAVDFLLKPFGVKELMETVERLVQKIKSKQKTERSAFSKLNAQFDKIPVPSLRGISFLPIKEILYLVSEGNYTTIYLDNKQKIVSSRNLGDYEALLENLQFFRIHHSTLINLAHIREYLRGEGGSVLLTDGTELDVSKRKKKEFLEVIGF
ncbi:LytR/AlgR family response regulator transcription factor [Runella salmonicolor]|uniref:LytTR family DNA-binding domain-containing protein n=1 Tax=Runella salmonicolor TaxID=2950278 RepID=A0ABT1FL86_9BACT|nr:LytTR family DNA-binding domain-containing protein [Runella salmonicolor]MCP1382529.1 LytTR family DNA-binding domain-containing protein [Runella salmonicolor]